MLRNMAPPVGFGKKCPYKLAYKVTTLDDECLAFNFLDRVSKMRRSSSSSAGNVV